MSKKPKSVKIADKRLNTQTGKSDTSSTLATIAGGLILGGLMTSTLAAFRHTPLKIVQALAPTIRDKKRAAKLLSEATGNEYKWTGKRFCKVEPKKKKPTNDEPATNN